MNDRLLGLEEQLDDMVMRAITKAQEHGFDTAQVLDALENVLKNQRRAYDLDPDPSPDPE
jgi:pyruvate/oxaloacetate carboxyltransferase